MKSNYFIFLIIICILLSISAVAAGGDEVALNADDNYQIIESNQDLTYNAICKSCDEGLIQSNGESANFTQFHEDIINSGGTFNLSHGYAYENDDVESGVFGIDDLVINGNNNVIDGRGSDFLFSFYPEVGSRCSLVINDLTFVNFNSSPLKFEKGVFTLNNVNITNCYVEDYELISTEDEIDLTLNGCNFYSNDVKGYLLAGKSRIMIYNSNFLGGVCRNSAIELNRAQLFIENSSFENCNARHGSIINFKGDCFKIRNSKFKNSWANSTGGAIIAKYFPLYEILDDDSRIFIPSDDMIIDKCTFSNISSSSNEGLFILTLIQHLNIFLKA